MIRRSIFASLFALVAAFSASAGEMKFTAVPYHQANRQLFFDGTTHPTASTATESGVIIRGVDTIQASTNVLALVAYRRAGESLRRLETVVLSKTPPSGFASALIPLGVEPNDFVIDWVIVLSTSFNGSQTVVPYAGN